LSESLGCELTLLRRPVILNYRFATPEQARSVPRRDIRLRECRDCGLIYNEIFDSSAFAYDKDYENGQNFSPIFSEMCRQTAYDLAAKHELAGGAVLEVGCGKGAFLKMLCEQYGCRGIGYDTSCEIEGTPNGGRVTFRQRYVTPEDVQERINLVICRHVIEHVPDIHEFLRLLWRLADAGGGSAVYIETPAFEWIVEQKAFWDVFYEHCNYFTTKNLRHLVELAGFEVLDQRLVFDGQYQALELRRRTDGKVPPPAHPEPLLDGFATAMAGAHRALVDSLVAAGALNGWAIWGAGAKGVTLVNSMEEMPPAFVIDSNPAKQGMHIPGTGTPVISPRDLRNHQVPVIFVANPNYLPEIRQTLASMGLSPSLLSH
jgi:SAM-dependent methyltransferase